MASAQAKKSAEETAGEKPPEPSADEQSFRVDEIERYLLAKGVRRQDVAGAFSGVSGAKRITISAAAKRVKAWRNAETLTDEDLTD